MNAGFISLPVIFLSIIAIAIAGGAGAVFYVGNNPLPTQDNLPILPTSTSEDRPQPEQPDFDTHYVGNEANSTGDEVSGSAQSPHIISSSDTDDTRVYIPVSERQSSLPPLPKLPAIDNHATNEDGTDYILIKGQLLSALRSDEKSFADLQNSVNRDKSLWSSLIKDIAQTRYSSLSLLSGGMSPSDLRDFVQRRANGYKEEAQSAHQTPDELYTPLQAAISAQLKKTEEARSGLWNKIPSDSDIKEINILLNENEKQAGRFIRLAIEANNIISALENTKAKLYTDTLNDIDMVLASRAGLAATEQKLQDIQLEASRRTLPNTEIRCNSYTRASGSFGSREYTSIIRCE